MFEATMMGLIQGLTEFLPVSSSAHLVFMNLWLGNKEANLAFDLLLHLGTLLAVSFALRQRILNLLKGMVQKDPLSLKTGLYIILSTAVTGLLGVLLEEKIEAAFNNPVIVCFCLLVTALVLWLSQKYATGTLAAHQVGIKKALILGLAQSLAMLPGISRSGTTIAAGLALKLKREDAGEYSFLLSIPIVLAAILFKLPELMHSPQTLSWPQMIWGVFVSFAVGLGSLYWLTSFIRKGKLHWFSFYLVLISLGHLLYFALN